MKNDRVLGVVLGPELKGKWRDYCAARNISLSTGIRLSIEKEIARVEALEEPETEVNPAPVEDAETGKKATLTITLDADMKSQWVRHCQRRGLTASGAIRESIKIELARIAKGSSHLFVQQEGTPEDGAKLRREVRLTPSEDRAIQIRAEQDGCSPQRWIVNVVRANLTHEPQFAMTAIEALWKSSGELRAIGRNLNQITRRINREQYGLPVVDMVEQVSASIQDHTEKVANLIDASLNRWVLR